LNYTSEKSEKEKNDIIDHINEKYLRNPEWLSLLEYCTFINMQTKPFITHGRNIFNF